MIEILTLFQTVLILFTVGLTWSSLRRFRESRGIDFTIEAEGAIDAARQSLIPLEPDHLRNIFQTYDIGGLSDDDLRAFPFMYCVYAHVSRMFFILSNDSIDVGLSKADRAQTIDDWFRYLRSFAGHPAMKAVHRSAVAHDDFNPRFLMAAVPLFEHGTLPPGSLDP